MDGFIQGAASIGFSTMHSVIRPPIESMLERRVLRIYSSPISPSSTGNSPTGSCSTTPSARTMHSASNLRYPSSSNTNPSAKGGGLMQGIDKRGFL